MSSDDASLSVAVRTHFHDQLVGFMDEFMDAFAGENFVISIKDWTGREHIFMARWSLTDFKHELPYGNTVPAGYTGTEPKVEYKINSDRQLELVNFSENSGFV